MDFKKVKSQKLTAVIPRRKRREWCIIRLSQLQPTLSLLIFMDEYTPNDIRGFDIPQTLFKDMLRAF